MRDCLTGHLLFGLLEPEHTIDVDIALLFIDTLVNN